MYMPSDATPRDAAQRSATHNARSMQYAHVILLKLPLTLTSANEHR